jgi:hypothetical protein
MKFYTLLITALASVWLAGCSSLSISYDYDQAVDFSKYKTYNWLPSPENMEVDTLNRARFVTAVERDLAQKNINKNASTPDLLIAVHFVKEKKINVTDWGYSYAPSGAYARHGYSTYNQYNYPTSGSISINEYEQGTLILDFIDPGTRLLIWRATVKSIISPASTPEKQTEKINNAVNEILQRFPPQPE